MSLPRTLILSLGGTIAIVPGKGRGIASKPGGHRSRSHCPGPLGAGGDRGPFAPAPAQALPRRIC